MLNMMQCLRVFCLPHSGSLDRVAGSLTNQNVKCLSHVFGSRIKSHNHNSIQIFLGHSTARESAHIVLIKLRSSLSLLHTHTQVNTHTVGGSPR